MSEPPHASAIAVAAAAFADFSAAQTHHSLMIGAANEEEQALRNDEAERARLIELEDSDQALRHVDGDDAAAPKPQRAKKLAVLNDRVPRRKAAIPLRKKRATEAAEAAEAARAPFTAAVIEAVSMIQHPAVERVRSILADLEEPLRELLTADMIQQGTIGERYSVPAGATPPFNGSTIVRKLLGGVAPRLLPPNLIEKNLEAGARAAAATAVRQIKENRA